MALQVNIKRKEPKFKGDKPRYNAVVSGPQETFTPKLCRMLEFQGLSEFKNDNGFSIWSSMPQIGGAPYYLTHLLNYKHNVQIHRDCRARAMDIVSERKPPDGLEHILGSGAVSAGRQKLQVVASKTAFVVNCDKNDEERRDFLEAAGWLPIKNVTSILTERLGTQPYYSRDPFIAMNLEKFMPEEARKLLNAKFRQATQNINNSKSHSDDNAIDVPVPDGLEFLPFQLKGITMAIESPNGTLIADDMGLGKTMQGIGVINASPDAKRILVISQANMRIKWTQEIEKWKTHSGLTVGMAESSNFPETDICVINYDILGKNEDALRAVDWDLIICDEAHNMKNPEAKRTMAVLGNLFDADGAKPLSLAENGKLIHLTGTPQPNRIDELWPLISSTRPDIWGAGAEDFQIFRNRYCPPVLLKTKTNPKFGNGRELIVPMPGKPIREAELYMRLRGSGSFVRRLKRDNPDLPPKFRTPLEIPVRLSADEKNALRDVEFNLEEMLKKTSGGEVLEGQSSMAGAVINQITRLNPDAPAFHEMARVRRNLGLIKAPHCAKFILDELEAEKDFAPEKQTKTVVFAHHKDVIKTIFAEAEKRMKGAFLIYDGSVSPAKKQALVDQFQNDEKIRGIILSLAGNSGITLTESARMRVVEPDWSPSNMIQIEDRIWRIGQMHNVDIGYMSVAGTMDARIGQAIADKMQTNERTLNSISMKHQPKTANSANTTDDIKPVKSGTSEVNVEKRDSDLPLFA